MSTTDELEHKAHADAAEPGWRLEPGGRTYVWWNGTKYTSRSYWSGTSWQFTPLSPTEPAKNQSTGTPKRRWRSWWWLLLLIPPGIALMGFLTYQFHEACCTHDLLEADFDVDAGRFETGERPDYTADLHEGSYRMTAKTASPAIPARSYAWLTRPAGAVSVNVTVVDPGAGELGVECIGGSAEIGYAFIVGGADARLIDLGSETVLERAPVVDLRPGQRLGLTCGFGDLEARIDGDVVMSATYQQRGMQTFNRAVLFFDPAHRGDFVRFDDVEAHLP